MAFLDDWDYELPATHIASRPAQRRDRSRLMVVPRAGAGVEHRVFTDIREFLRPGDLLVGNDTRVMASRVQARRASGGAVEVLFLEAGDGPVQALARPARRLKAGEELEVEGVGRIHILERPNEDGVLLVQGIPSARVLMEGSGEMPLPPYLGRRADDQDTERYQTVYAGPLGAAAAPTAGLHFTQELLEELRAAGVGFETLTLHVGIGTFRPLRPEDVEAGELHPEWFQIPAGLRERIRQTRERGGRVIAVGTTSARALEAATPEGSRVPAVGEASTRIFIQPPYRFRAVDGLITNFHLPRSSLMMLVASLVDRERLLACYREAVDQGYRFYSYGDAMLLV